jgi:hypothetical protein
MDGWLVRIKCPDLNRLIILVNASPENDEFYAINVQAIVDKEKRILWRSILTIILVPTSI